MDQIERNFQHKAQEVVYDLGGRGKTQINGVQISTINKPLKQTAFMLKGSKEIRSDEVQQLNLLLDT